MMIKITERCTMRCKHCMNSSEPGGHDMTIDTLDDVLKFLSNHNLGRFIIITGGEPTEHRHFDAIMNHILEYQKSTRYFMSITITTNGEAIQNDPERFKDYVSSFKSFGCILLFQVSADVRYYPRRINVHKRIFREDGFVLCDDCVQQIYPQGRAYENNLEWKSVGSKCFNVRALSKQLPDPSLASIEAYLAVKSKFCTPHIAINGDIKLGESDLCPKCASIYDIESDIIHKIQNFKCNGCDIINSKLPDNLRKFVE